MRLADVFSGSAFRMAVIAGLIFSLALCAVGISLYYVLRASLVDELEVQLVTELKLFRRIHETAGLSSLNEAVRQLEKPAIAGGRLAGVYDQSGVKISGNIDVAPDTVFSEQKMVLIPDANGDLVFVHHTTIANHRLVIGRNPNFFQTMLSEFVHALAIAGVSALVGSLFIGWILSRRSMHKLAHIAATLERIAHGDTEARVLAGDGNGQIDRVSRLIDASLERLSALMESTHNTTRAIAHDLRSPLNRAFILVREAAESGDTEKLNDAEKALFELSSIFDTVLRISRLQSSGDNSAFSPVDLPAVIHEVAEVFESAFADKLQTAVLPSASTEVMIFADAQMLKQLITNLFQNFNRHTPAGSRVIVTIATRRNGDVILRVADDGQGIPAESCESVMKPFFRLDASRTDEGSGLGLALVNAIAVRHSAKVVLSDNSPGLCVEIGFPAFSTKLAGS